jgi:hypothetical protein
MTVRWPDYWQWVWRGDAVFHLERFSSDGWYVVTGWSTLAIVGSSSAALAAVDAFAAKMKSGIDGST